MRVKDNRESKGARERMTKRDCKGSFLLDAVLRSAIIYKKLAWLLPDSVLEDLENKQGRIANYFIELQLTRDTLNITGFCRHLIISWRTSETAPHIFL